MYKKINEMNNKTLPEILSSRLYRRENPFFVGLVFCLFFLGAEGQKYIGH